MHRNLEEDDNPIIEDLKYQEELEGFFSGASSQGTVNLQAQPVTLGNASVEGQPTAAPPGAKEEKGSNAAAAGLIAAATAAAGALMGGRLPSAVVEGVASAAVPTSLEPIKARAGKFLQSAQPWREFVLPLSLPPAKEGCSRLTANIYTYQTNYAILFMIQLGLSILLDTSALTSIIIITVVWVLFLKKNDDPDWKPEIGGMQLGPIQRWLLLSVATTLVLLFVAGRTISNAVGMYVVCGLAHGIIHAPKLKGIAGDDEGADNAVAL